jgi:hypothetical protein
MKEKRKEEIARICLDWILDSCIGASYMPERREMLERLGISNEEAIELGCYYAIK